jgi:hypothetical protein
MANDLSLKFSGGQLRMVFSTDNLLHVINLCDFVSIANRLLTAKGSGRDR